MIHAESPTFLVRAAQKIREELERTSSNQRLAGRCGIASIALLREIKKVKGAKACIVENDSHCFVRSEDFIADVTATQFGFRRVVIWPAKDAARLSKIWQIQRKFSSLTQFSRHQKKFWIKEQWGEIK